MSVRAHSSPGRLSPRNPAETVTSAASSAKATLGWAYRSGGSRGVRETAGDYATSSQLGSVNLIGVMFAIILAAAIGMVGTTVISEIDASIDTAGNSEYANASNSISEGFANAMGLTDIVFLVLMFVVVISALFMVRRAR